MGTVISLRPNSLAEDLRDLARRVELGTVTEFLGCFYDEDGVLQTAMMGSWGDIYIMHHDMMTGLDTVRGDEDVDED